MIQRMIGAAQLKAEIYEEVEADKSATGQAMTVVVLAALATGIGFLGVGGADAVDVVFGVVLALLGWALLAWITYMVGTRLFPTPDTSADWGELARTLGFAQSSSADWGELARTLGFAQSRSPEDSASFQASGRS